MSDVSHKYGLIILFLKYILTLLNPVLFEAKTKLIRSTKQSNKIIAYGFSIDLIVIQLT